MGAEVEVRAESEALPSSATASARRSKLVKSRKGRVPRDPSTSLGFIPPLAEGAALLRYITEACFLDLSLQTSVTRHDIDPVVQSRRISEL